ncbi:ATP-binding cassette domain-containing protein, partial [Desulfamplus magnetovallimortis]|uniref:ATP-binding cassette domain-containing protein n=1 Tax=Desulfamplus magnetovallimortis TaxID=1246637 RepID=UPI00111B78AE
MNESICVENLTKRFEKIEAVNGISFRVKKGELFGFLGPNGAGKTTTINMLTGLAR